MENHVKFTAAFVNTLEDFNWIIDSRHLANRESIVLFQNLANVLEILMESWAASVMLSAVLVFS